MMVYNIILKNILETKRVLNLEKAFHLRNTGQAQYKPRPQAL